ncbi:MAG: rod shape-determining protein RodA [Kiritimatiellales bacterium]|nr:rod shape-determining protein RodA [Kiritimatiellota bacterium]MBL7011981.1 rod shape-determining protein RodA [Kiritimatiellales bacterium]
MIGRIRRFDWTMFGTILVLLVLSFLFVYSAGYQSGEVSLNGKALRQVIWALIGIGCYAAAAAFDYRKLKDIHWWFFAGTAGALLIVLFFGTSIYGANRWFSIGGIMIQPSEFAKLAAVLSLAAYLSNPATDPDEFGTFAKAFLIMLVPFTLILIEPDLGTSMVLIPLTLALLFCAGTPLRPLLILIGAGFFGLIVLAVWLRFFPDTCPFLTEYQKSRVLVYLNVSQDPLGAGWNKLQSQIAVGSGGLFGKGYLKGTQNILGFLPRTVAPTDFIYSVVAEETGFAGSGLLLVLYTTVTVRCMRAAVQARDLFGRLLATGVGVLLFTHVFINIAMTVGLMPITGLPLPLMSYGGSFMVTTMGALGLVQSVYLRRRTI